MTTKIIGTGHYVPERIVTNDDLAMIMDTSDEWIVERTGIRQRRIDTGEGVVSMALKASKNALENAGITADMLDMIIVATSTADDLFPNTASLVQRELGNHQCVCFDLSAACSGFLYGLNTAHAYIKAGMAKTVLIIGSECLSKTMDWTDRSTSILFGDGAGAVIVTEAETGIESVVAHSDGRKGEVIICDGRPLENFLVKKNVTYTYTQMDGQEVFRFAVKTVPECIHELLDQAKIGVEDVDYFILHQANERIIRSVSKRLRVPLERFPMNLHNYGNTSAASIPILLDECNRNGLFVPGHKIVLSGFGAGLTWGAALLTW
ncbi:MAG: beta-ketoacyl-ACP synthase III [Candidatus Fimimorpha sp.]